MSATVGNGKRGPALTPSELDNILAQVGLTQGDFEVMNGGGGSNPGTSLMGKFDPTILIHGGRWRLISAMVPMSRGLLPAIK